MRLPFTRVMVKPLQYHGRFF